MSTCTLCDLPIGDQSVTATDRDIEGEFCCRGCLEISKLIDAGEETELSVSDIRDRVDESERKQGAREDESERNRRESITEDERTDREDAETTYRSVDGMHCKTCEGFIELLAEETDGIYEARASYATEMVELSYDPATIDGDGITDSISRLGYHASEPGAEDDGSLLGRLAFDRYRAGFAAILMMPVLVLYLLFIYPVYLGIYPEEFLYGSSIEAMVFGPLIVWSTLIVLGLGYPIFRGAYVSLRVGQPNMDVLIALAVLAAYLYSVVSYFTGGRDPYFDVAVMVLVVVTIGNHIETRVKRDALGNRSLLTESRVTEARRRGEHDTEMIDVEACTDGDELLVKPGERVPIDGTVIDGTAAVDESLITGESIPETKSVGDQVFGGSVLTDSALVIEVGDAASSTIDRLVELLWNVKSADSGIQRLVNRFAVLFVPLVILLAGGTTLLWLALGAPMSTAILTGVSVLVISCPCSLGIATPLALAAGSRDASRAGILLINETILERVEESEIVVFDKTGTLTTGEIRVRDVISGSHTAESELLARAAAVERRSSHPIAAAIAERAPQTQRSVSEFERGERTVSALVEGEQVVVGHPSAFETEEWSIPKSVRDAIDSAYRSGVHPTAVGWDGTVHGIITSADTPRDGWETVLTELGTAHEREADREIVVLTGDDERLSQEFADHPAVDHVFAGVRPESKKAIIGGLTERGTTTMVGDGTNDAPALARADLGIAVSSGTEIAIEAADAVIMNDQLDSVSTIFQLARSTRERIKWNLVWAGLYNAIALPLAIASLITPLIAAGCMAVSSLVVVFNSKRSLIPSGDSETTSQQERTSEHASEPEHTPSHSQTS